MERFDMSSTGVGMELREFLETQRNLSVRLTEVLAAAGVELLDWSPSGSGVFELRVRLAEVGGGVRNPGNENVPRSSTAQPDMGGYGLYDPLNRAGEVETNNVWIGSDRAPEDRKVLGASAESGVPAAPGGFVDEIADLTEELVVEAAVEPALLAEPVVRREGESLGDLIARDDERLVIRGAEATGRLALPLLDDEIRLELLAVTMVGDAYGHYEVAGGEISLAAALANAKEWFVREVARSGRADGMRLFETALARYSSIGTGR